MPTPLRRDAARNRERLIAAARRTFTAQGPDAPLEEVARAADVSRTTLHRHFEDRDALVAAVLEQNVTDIEARAADLLDADDGAERLFHYLLDVQASAPWLARVAASHGIPTGTLALAERTAAALEPLVDRARARGTLHPELGTADVLLALPMAMAAHAVREHPGGSRRSGHMRTILHRGLFTTHPPVPDDGSSQGGRPS